MDEAKLQIKLLDHKFEDDTAYVCVGFRGGFTARDFFLDGENHVRGSYAFYEVLFEYLNLCLEDDSYNYSFSRSSSYISFSADSSNCTGKLKELLSVAFGCDYDEEKFQKALDSVQDRFGELYDDVPARARYKALEVSEFNKQFELGALTDDYWFMDFELFVQCAKMLIVPGNVLIYIVGDADKIALSDSMGDIDDLFTAVEEHSVLLGGYPQDPYLRQDMYLDDTAEENVNITVEAFDFINEETTCFIRYFILDILSASLPGYNVEISVDYFDSSIMFESDEPIRCKRALYDTDEQWFQEAKEYVLQKYYQLLEEEPELFTAVATYFGLIEIQIDEYLDFVEKSTYSEFLEICEEADFKVTEALVILREEQSENGENDQAEHGGV